jgi:hypothetical protein
MAAAVGAESERWCIVLVVVEHDGSLVLIVEPTRLALPCPHCGELRRRQHSRYERHPLDLPWRGKTVRMRIRSRRWFLRRVDLPAEDLRRTFRRPPGSLCAADRRHHRSADDVRAAGRLQAGEGGARLARKAGVPVSPDTLLRVLHALADADDQRGPRVLRVDDVGLAPEATPLRHVADRPRDAPTDRSARHRTADVFANWLRHHPGVGIIVRDWARAYVEGGRQGAPDAIQVADRFHLCANAGAALEEVLRTRRRHIEYVVVSEPAKQLRPTPTAPLPPPSQTQQNLAIQRTRRSARWDDVRARRAEGYGTAHIPREMGMHRRTVRRYIATPVPPRNRPTEHPKPGGLTSPSLQPFVDYLLGGGRPAVPTSRRLARRASAPR